MVERSATSGEIAMELGGIKPSAEIEVGVENSGGNGILGVPLCLESSIHLMERMCC